MSTFVLYSLYKTFPNSISTVARLDHIIIIFVRFETNMAIYIETTRCSRLHKCILRRDHKNIVLYSKGSIIQWAIFDIYYMPKITIHTVYVKMKFQNKLITRIIYP